MRHPEPDLNPCDVPYEPDMSVEEAVRLGKVMILPDEAHLEAIYAAGLEARSQLVQFHKQIQESSASMMPDFEVQARKIKAAAEKMLVRAQAVTTYSETSVLAPWPGEARMDSAVYGPGSGKRKNAAFKERQNRKGR